VTTPESITYTVYELPKKYAKFFFIALLTSGVLKGTTALVVEKGSSWYLWLPNTLLITTAWLCFVAGRNFGYSIGGPWPIRSKILWEAASAYTGKYSKGDRVLWCPYPNHPEATALTDPATVVDVDATAVKPYYILPKTDDSSPLWVVESHIIGYDPAFATPTKDKKKK